MPLDLSPSAFEPVLKALASAGLPAIEQTLTQVVATSVAGPFGGLISTAVNPIWSSVNRALGLDPETAPEQTAAAIQADPAAARDRLAAVEEQHSSALAMFNAQASADLAERQEVDRAALSGDALQADLDRQAASSASFFVYGPRPAILWGVGALIVAYGAAPLFGWLAEGFFGVRLGAPPALPWYVWLCAFGLLGIVSALRSFDKRHGTAALPPAAPAAAPGRRR